MTDAEEEVARVFGENLRRLRNAHELTQRELHKLSGVSVTSISQMERAKTWARKDKASRLAISLGAPLIYFYQQNNPEPLPEKKLVLRGELIRNYLNHEGRKRAWLANKLNISPSYLDQMMAGRVPGPEVLKNVADILKVKRANLLRAPAEPKSPSPKPKK